jgi:PAS domain S-box-containing protein
MLPLITLILFVFFIFYLGFGIYILLRMPNSLKNRIFFSICLHLSLWSFGYAFMSFAPTREKANFWRVVASLGWCFVYSLWLDFAILIRNNDNKKWMTDIRRFLLYIPSILFFLFDLRYKPNQVIEKFAHIWRDTYPINNYEILYAIYYISYALAGIYIIYEWGKKSTLNREKKQANVIVTTALVTFFMGVLIKLLLPKITINVFPLDVIIFSAFLFGTYQAITMYQMMTITTLDANDYVLGNISDPVFILGNDLLIKEMNKAANQLTGFKTNELIGSSINSIIPEEEFGCSIINTSLQKRNDKAIEVQLLTKENVSIPCLFSAGMITNKYDEALGMACIFHDITDRKNAEKLLITRKYELESLVDERTKELQELNSQLRKEISERKKAEERVRLSEERLRTIIMKSSEGIIIIDQNKDEFLECNAVAREILSLGDVKLPDMMRKIHSMEYYSELSVFLHENLKQNSQQPNITIKLNTKENISRTIELSVTRVGFSKKFYAMLTLRDITEHIVMEERNQHLAKMESIGTLSGGIAHDFNNILAGIIGYTQLTLDDLHEDSSLADNLTEVLNLGERAKNLISQILTFSKKSLIKKETTDLYQITDEVVKMLKTTLPAQMELVFTKSETPYYVYADMGEMQQLIMNLCINAKLAFDDDNGMVTIKLSEIKIGKESIGDFNLERPGSYIQLVVSDNGCGMDEEIQKMIFEPFFTKRSSNKGTGLGLAVVHGIVTRMEGGIRVESEPGKGSIFYIVLPKDDKINQKQILPTSIPDSNRLRILLVDNEEIIVSSVKKLLSKRGYIVSGVTKAEDAKKLFISQPEAYDILITDQSMPNLTGDELLEELRKFKPVLPAIICSGIMHMENSSDQDERTLYLLKPVAVIDYLTAIERLRNVKTPG